MGDFLLLSMEATIVALPSMSPLKIAVLLAIEFAYGKKSWWIELLEHVVVGSAFVLPVVP